MLLEITKLLRKLNICKREITDQDCSFSPEKKLYYLFFPWGEKPQTLKLSLDFLV